MVTSGRRQFLVGAGSTILGGALTLGTRPSYAQATAPRPAKGGVTPSPDVITIRRGDGRYEGMRFGSNQRFGGIPNRIVLPGDSNAVRAAVEDALNADDKIAARGGGHCYENFVSNDKVHRIIDLKRLNDVVYDSEHGAYSVGAGCTLLNVYDTLFKEAGLVVPAGSCPSVGVGGFVPSGGYGPLSRRHGLAVDHLYGVEVVVVDKSGTPKTVVATRDSDADLTDLWWGFTGAGGGNFGIATRYLFRSSSGGKSALPAAPSEVLIRTVSWNWSELNESRFARLVKNYGDWHVDNSTPNSAGVALFAQLKLLHQKSGIVALSVQVDASTRNASTLLDNFINEVANGVGTPAGPPPMIRGWHHALQWDGFSPANQTIMRFKIKSANMKSSFPENQISALYKNLTTQGVEGTQVVTIASYGGKINAVRPRATATWARDSVMRLQYTALWEDESGDSSNLAWVRRIYSEVYASTGGVPVSNDVTSGCYIGYPDLDLSETDWNTSDRAWHDLYYGQNYGRLQRVKERWDPLDVFSHGQSVTLPS